MTLFLVDQDGTLGKYAVEVNRVIGVWAESTIDETLRKHSLALELARLGELLAGRNSTLRRPSTR